MNKVTDEFRQLLTEKLEKDRIIGLLPQDNGLFMTSLKGEPLQAALPEIEKICEFVTGYKKPVSLAVTF